MTNTTELWHIKYKIMDALLTFQPWEIINKDVIRTIMKQTRDTLTLTIDFNVQIPILQSAYDKLWSENEI